MEWLAAFASAREAATSVELLIRGLACGVAIAAPVGPVNVICMQRTVTKGWRSGIVSGFGSAAADTIYGAIAGFSISFVIGFLIREEHWIRLYGGMLLIAIGLWYFLRKPGALQGKGQGEGESERSDWLSAFLLTLTNPTTVLSFMAVLAALGLGQSRTWWLTWFVVAGIFAGSMLWWFVLTSAIHHYRDRFNDRALGWINRAGGAAIGLFGMITMLLARQHPR